MRQTRLGSLFLIFCAALPFRAIAAEDRPSIEQQFNTAYKAFRTAAQDNNADAQHQHATVALRLGSDLFAEDSQTLAVLTMNAALAYPTAWGLLPAHTALPSMQRLVTRYESLFGQDSIDVIEPLLLLAETLTAYSLHSVPDESTADARTRILDTETEIASLTQRIYHLTKRFGPNIDAATVLQRLGGLRTGFSEEATLSAIKIRDRTLGPQHPLTLSTRYFYANNFLKRAARLREFESLLESQALPVQIRTAALHQLSLKTNTKADQYRAQLTTLLGDQVASKTINDDYLPVAKTAPIYPRRALSKGWSGYVILEFTVTEVGFVEDITAIESCVYKRQGQCSDNSIFDKASITSAKTFRYVPRFVDGLPVRTYGVQNKVTFEVM